MIKNDMTIKEWVVKPNQIIYIPIKIRIYPVDPVLVIVNTHPVWPSKLISMYLSHVTPIAMATTNEWKVTSVLKPISKEYIPLN